MPVTLVKAAELPVLNQPAKYLNPCDGKQMRGQLMNREMKACRDSITCGFPNNWSFGGDRFSSAHDNEIYGLFRASGNFAVARRIHSYLVEIITGPGTGNLYHSAVTGGKVNAQGHLFAIQQHGHAGRKHENGDRIYPPEGQRDVHSPPPRPSRTRASCSSAIQTRTVNYHSRYRNRLIGGTVRTSVNQVALL
jgi:hypothetical protein